MGSIRRPWYTAIHDFWCFFGAHRRRKLMPSTGAHVMHARTILASLALLATTTMVQAAAPSETVKPNFSEAIPNLPGKSLTAVEVLFPPGAASHPHKHAHSAFIYAYVVSGHCEPGGRATRAHLHRRRKLSRGSRRAPPRCPQSEQHGAREAAGGVRGRQRRGGPDDTGPVSPRQRGGITLISNSFGQCFPVTKRRSFAAS